jgi:hypothetical protein
VEATKCPPIEGSLVDFARLSSQHSHAREMILTMLVRFFRPLIGRSSIEMSFSVCMRHKARFAVFRQTPARAAISEIERSQRLRRLCSSATIRAIAMSAIVSRDAKKPGSGPDHANR